MAGSAMRAMVETAGERMRDAAPAQLSTDYLNRYGEALMLIEVASLDHDVVADLRAWRPLGYRLHFETSQLRCRESAIRAYDSLSAERRNAFEVLCGTMDNLILTTAELLAQRPDTDETGMCVADTCATLRVQIGRATQFINANGCVDIDTIVGKRLQDEIDSLFKG
jgi:hypothetical protein